MDHVLPLSLGGETKWENVVAACASCNGKKANKVDIKPKDLHIGQNALSWSQNVSSLTYLKHKS